MINVRLLDVTPAQIAQYGDTQGHVWLDLAGLDFRFTKVLEELTDANKIRQSAGLSVSIPGSRRNRALLERYEANALRWLAQGAEDDVAGTALRVQVLRNGEPVAVDRMRVWELRDEFNGQGEIEVEFIGTGWVDALAALRLRSLDLGVFEYTTANVISSWSVANPGILAQPTMAHYGAFNQEDEISRRDLRMWFGVYELLKRAFCEVGWSFKSPWLESIAGDGIMAYLSGAKWYSYRGKFDELRVDLTLNAPQVVPAGVETVLFDEEHDPFNLYNFGTFVEEYLYPPAGQSPIDMRVIIRHIRVRLPATGDLPAVFFVLPYKRRAGAAQVFWLGYESWPGSVTEEQVVDLSWEFLDEDCRAGDVYGFFWGYQSLDTSNVYSFTFEEADISFSPDPPRYIEDDLVVLADLIDPSLTAEDLFKGVAHMCGGKIETDFVERAVTLYPPHDATFEGVAIEGYFERGGERQDITDLVEQGSRATKIEKDRRARYVWLKFKEGDDAYIEQTGRENVHARRVDLGSGKDKEDELENPLFEPTLEIFAEGREVGGDGIFLPALWDNAEGRVSGAVGYRVGFRYGQAQQLKSGGGSYSFVFEGASRSVFGYVAQLATRPVLSISPAVVPLVFAEHRYDLWRMYYRRWLQEQFAAVNLEFLVHFNFHQFNSLNFRLPFAFTYSGAYLLYQGLAARDYPVDEGGVVPVEMVVLDC